MNSGNHDRPNPVVATGPGTQDQGPVPHNHSYEMEKPVLTPPKVTLMLVVNLPVKVASGT